MFNKFMDFLDRNFDALIFFGLFILVASIGLGMSRVGEYLAAYNCECFCDNVDEVDFK